jgi:hypothetical protein
MKAGSVAGPVWEGITSRVAECGDEVADRGTALIQIFEQAGQIPGIIARPPFVRHPLGESPEVCTVDLLSSAEDWFKRVPAGHRLINGFVRINTSQGCVQKAPFSRIETIVVVYESGLVAASRSCEDGLPSIAVAGPFIEYEHAAKISQIGHFAERTSGQMVRLGVCCP